MKIEIRITSSDNVNKAYYFYVGYCCALMKQKHMEYPLFDTSTAIKDYKSVRLLSKIFRLRQEVVRLNK